jgi:hypothetical protein
LEKLPRSDIASALDKDQSILISLTLEVFSEILAHENVALGQLVILLIEVLVLRNPHLLQSVLIFHLLLYIVSE